MNDPTFALMVFLTIFSWLVTAYCIYQAWDRRRNKPVNPMVGHIDRIFSDENGVHVEGRLNETGKGLVDQGHNRMSLGFHDLGYIKEDGVRTIREAKIHSVSLDRQPGPYGGPIHFVGTQPDER